MHIFSRRQIFALMFLRLSTTNRKLPAIVEHLYFKFSPLSHIWPANAHLFLVVTESIVMYFVVSESLTHFQVCQMKHNGTDPTSHIRRCFC